MYARRASKSASAPQRRMGFISPFRIAVPFWGHPTQNLSNFSPKRDCGSKRVNLTINIYFTALLLLKNKRCVVALLCRLGHVRLRLPSPPDGMGRVGARRDTTRRGSRLDPTANSRLRFACHCRCLCHWPDRDEPHRISLHRCHKLRPVG